MSLDCFFHPSSFFLLSSFFFPLSSFDFALLFSSFRFAFPRFSFLFILPLIPPRPCPLPPPPPPPPPLPPRIKTNGRRVSPTNSAVRLFVCLVTWLSDCLSAYRGLLSWYVWCEDASVFLTSFSLACSLAMSVRKCGAGMRPWGIHPSLLTMSHYISIFILLKIWVN